MDDDSGGAVFDDDAPGDQDEQDEQDEQDGDFTDDSSDLVELDLDEEDTPVSVHGAGTASAAAPPAAVGRSVLDRMRSAGISEERARLHLLQGWVRLDGQVITDPDHGAPPLARWTIQPPADLAPDTDAGA